MNKTVDNYNDLYLIKEQKIDRLFGDNCSKNKFVLSEAILYALNLIEVCYDDRKSRLLSVNTDGLFIQNPKRTFKNREDIKFSAKKIGKLFQEDKIITYLEKKLQR